MAKIVFNEVKNGNSLSTINGNFALIASEMQNKILYRNNPVGEPNAIITDVDLNGNDIINGGNITATGLVIGGVDFEVSIAEAIAEVEVLVQDAADEATAAAASAVTASTQAGIATTQATNAAASAAASAQNVVDTQAIEDEVDAKLADIAMGPVISVSGMGGIITTPALKTALAIDQVDNTSDVNKPVSSATSAAIAAALAAATPSGQLGWFARASAPSGWVAGTGATIGSAASGATGRANADTQTLFVLWWNDFDNTVLPIQDSAGVATTRGLTALDDFNANKRLPTFDMRDDFVRGSSATNVIGVHQTGAIESHTHTNSVGNNSADHTHSVNITSGGDSVDHTHQGQFASTVVGVTPGGNSISVINGANQSTSGISAAHTHSVVGTTGGISAAHNHTVTINATGGTETKPRNTPHLACYKL
jgi:hypothetical protein